MQNIICFICFTESFLRQRYENKSKREKKTLTNSLETNAFDVGQLKPKELKKKAISKEKQNKKKIQQICKTKVLFKNEEGI